MAPHFTNTWTVGNVITIATLIIGGAVLWGELRAELHNQRSAVIRTENLMAAKTASDNIREERVRILENNASRTDERLISIINTLNRIERQLDNSPNPGSR